MQLKKQTKCWFSQLHEQMDFKRSIKPGKTFDNTWKTSLAHWMKSVCDLGKPVGVCLTWFITM